MASVPPLPVLVMVAVFLSVGAVGTLLIPVREASTPIYRPSWCAPSPTGMLPVYCGSPQARDNLSFQIMQCREWFYGANASGGPSSIPVWCVNVLRGGYVLYPDAAPVAEQVGWLVCTQDMWGVQLACRTDYVGWA